MDGALAIALEDGSVGAYIVCPSTCGELGAGTFLGLGLRMIARRDASSSASGALTPLLFRLTEAAVLPIVRQTPLFRRLLVGVVPLAAAIPVEIAEGDIVESFNREMVIARR